MKTPSSFLMLAY